MSYKLSIHSLCNFSTVRYDRKPFEQIKLQILTCCLKQWRHRDLFEVQRTAPPKRHTNYKYPRQTINHIDTLILIIQHLRSTRKTWSQNLQKYVLLRVDGPSSLQTGDDGVGDTRVCYLCDKTPMFLRKIAYY